jgi:hypothetical protein
VVPCDLEAIGNWPLLGGSSILDIQTWPGAIGSPAPELFVKLCSLPFLVRLASLAISVRPGSRVQRGGGTALLNKLERLCNSHEKAQNVNSLGQDRGSAREPWRLLDRFG